MNVIAQKPISDFFNTKPNKQAKIIKYCISKRQMRQKTKKTKLYVKRPQRVRKTIEKLLRLPKRDK